MSAPAAGPRPHYVTLSGGQVRVWRVGEGPDLLLLSGLTLAAQDQAALLAAACPGWRVTAVELPGVGGSATHAAASLPALAEAVREFVHAAGLTEAIVVGAEHAAVVAHAAAAGRASFGLGLDRLAGWASTAAAMPDVTPRQDGTHLTALWSFVRDRHILHPDDPRQPAAAGDPLPDAAVLDRAITAAAVAPERFAALWETLSRAPAPPLRAATVGDLAAQLPAGATGAAPLPQTAPTDGIFHRYVETARGRLHLRCAGAAGRPTLVIPTGGGSSAQFAPVIAGLAAAGRQAFAVDYFGNGLSDDPAGPVTTETLAADMAALLDALGHDVVDVWGSHTGSLVALELAVSAPERVRRLVMEGPVFISADFQDDLLAHYFPDFTPDPWGRHLSLVWNWRRDAFFFWPWYRRTREAVRAIGLPSAEDLHLYAVGIMESGTTYDAAYRTAFRYATGERMPRLTRPALVCAGPNDMLIEGLAATRALAVPGVTVKTTPTTVWWPDPEPQAAAETMALYVEFLDGE
ncbi:alpha/beta fold hydrolase [Acuticoccus sp. I52.16.1]|uniref:alpha/beta fold hydrolase n=1 Tax=Acuticoccus sp. I52.16.1 TaxID=2928472 RepID=UPI001FD21C90|nr:alpha/beta hydrolase [Acuticoccus sp. I52.16.1]UOM35394.1 alpha/beta fold hydrolase [Acuticoccus sp. I52.16.1]